MKKIHIFLGYLLLIFFFTSSTVSVLAHETTLEIEYDTCSPQNYVNSSNIGDSYNEKWYELVKDNLSYHIPHSESNVTEIRYYISPVGKDDDSITWSNGITGNLSNRIIDGFIESMKKWNNVWYYLLNSEGLYEKRKVVNIVEGTEDDHNLIIYPAISKYVATTRAISSKITVPSVNSINHEHYDEWEMEVDVSKMANLSSRLLNIMLSRTGAHEVGHVLGLKDIDSIENPNEISNYHHEEILMGYSKDNYGYSRQTEITYKDIAGVAITRGFHADSDHLWLYDQNHPKDGKEKLICSLCNCVKYVDDLTNYNYYLYNQCGHNESNSLHTVDENMIPVASYGDKDYYKCKYCRYVAPFTSIISQNYDVELIESDYHILSNSSDGLTYQLKEEHDLSISCGNNNYKCSKCNYYKIEEYDTVILNGNSSSNNRNFILQENESIFYRLIVNEKHYYEIKAKGNNLLDCIIYDENYNVVEINDLNSSSFNEHIVVELEEGRYFLRLMNEGSINNSIDFTINAKSDSYLSDIDNDILIDVYNNEDNVYTFVNLGAPSYYKISLDARLLNNQNISCLYGAIQVVDEETKEHAFKYNINSYQQYSFNEEEVNYVYVYLEDYKVYEVYITLPSNEYTKANLKIEKVVSEDINVIERFNQEFSETIINNSSDIEYVTSFSIDQTSIFNIEVDVNNYNSSNILFMLFKQEYDTYHATYFTTSILTENLTNSHLEERYLLEEGIYYIGYFNNYYKKEIEVTLNRELKTSDIIDQVIVMDMHPQLPYGTEVRHNKKAYGLSTITEGYTRHIHFLNVTGVPSVSRYDYNYYTSSESIASVSSYGTVLAKQVSLDLTVIITAQYKEDLSIIFTIELTILNDDSNEEKEIESTQTVRIDSLENNRYKLVLTELNSVYPWIQEYDFHIVPNESNTNIATINTFGYITFNTYEDIIVIGQYKINSNVRLKIHIRLVS